MIPSFNKTFSNDKGSTAQGEGLSPFQSGGNQQDTKDVSVIAILSTTLLLLSFFALGGMYAYRILLTNTVKSYDTLFDAEKERLKPEVVAEIVAFSQRVETLKRLETRRPFISNVFKRFEAYLPQSVVLRSFNVTRVAGSNTYTISYAGEANSPDTLITKLRNFEDDELLSRIKMGDFTLRVDDQGIRSYLFSANGTYSQEDFVKILAEGAPQPSALPSQPFTEGL